MSEVSSNKQISRREFLAWISAFGLEAGAWIISHSKNLTSGSASPVIYRRLEQPRELEKIVPAPATATATETATPQGTPTLVPPEQTSTPDSSLRELIQRAVEKYGYTNLLFPVSQSTRLPENFPYRIAEIPLEPWHVDSSIMIGQLVRQPLDSLFSAASQAGFNPMLISGFRSIETQSGIFNAYVQALVNSGLPRDSAEVEANKFSARPGFSEHHLGTTVDLCDRSLARAIQSGDGWDFARQNFDQGIFGWLRENSHRFGFVISYPTGSNPFTAKEGSGYPSAEPWHIRFVGEELAGYLQKRDYLNPANDTTLDSILKGA